MLSRRTLVARLGAFCTAAFTTPHGIGALVAVDVDAGTPGGWQKYPGNPVLGKQYGTCFDICVLSDKGRFRMWLSWRPTKSVAISESEDGIHWSAPEVVLAPNRASGWEDDLNRPVVVHRDGIYHMWYTGQTWSSNHTKGGHEDGHSMIGYATSENGHNWIRQSARPTLKPELPWEGVALMCPHVLWDKQLNLWRMWYSGGEQYEPNAIGHATSSDGLLWVKDSANPILKPDAHYAWESQRVAGAQVLQWDNWFYAFYIGYRDIDHAQVGLARSRDGIHGWERYPANPIVRATGSGFDADACYKPYALFKNGKWMLWYNGRSGHLEQIGLVTRAERDLWARGM
jgi:predicted GH43/DUF377 family glycosyl hydrolase